MKELFKKENLKIYWEKAVKLFSHASKVAVISIAMFVGFSFGEIYHNYQEKMKSQELQQTKGSDVTSIAINERGEVMIVDRKTGAYQVFSDDVGRMIFDIYAAKMYFTATKSQK